MRIDWVSSSQLCSYTTQRVHISGLCEGNVQHDLWCFVLHDLRTDSRLNSRLTMGQAKVNQCHFKWLPLAIHNHYIVRFEVCMYNIQYPSLAVAN